MSEATGHISSAYRLAIWYTRFPDLESISMSSYHCNPYTQHDSHFNAGADDGSSLLLLAGGVAPCVAWGTHVLPEI